MVRIGAFAALLMLLAVSALAQVTAVPSLMNYEGRLTLPDGTPVPNGTYSVRFSLWNAAAGGTEKWNQTVNSVTVRNGTFVVLLANFPPGTFNGNLWMETKVGSEAPLTPRQQLVSVPYAFKADKVRDGAITTGSLAANAITSAKIANGTITAADIAPGALNSLSWLLGGNSGTNPANHFLGTTDNQPLQLGVNNRRAVRLEYAVATNDNLISSGLNTIGGFWANSVSPGVVGATVWGGWHERVDIFSDDYPNIVTDIGGTVSGGRRNRAGNNAGTVYDASHATVGGGELNIASGIYSTISGGGFNTAPNEYATVGGGRTNTANGNFATVGGGFQNAVHGSNSTIAGGSRNMAVSGGAIGGGSDNNVGAPYGVVAGGANNVAYGSSAIGGGLNNTAGSVSGYATVSGGSYNQANGNHSMIPGGRLNVAQGSGSFAAGYRARAEHNGAFVWADFLDYPFASTATNQFNVRATGGVRIVTNINTSGAPTAGVTLTAGDSSWNSLSDRNAKRNFQQVNPEDILERLRAIPISTWNYKSRDDIRHIGPMAQDFYAAFGLGTDEKHISTVDADGVALAAIQGLYRKVQAQQKQTDELKSENAALKQQLAELSALVRQVKLAQEELRANTPGK